MERRYYIAYGSNLNVEQMNSRCPNAEIVGKSVIRDYELLFKGSLTGSYLTIEKKEGSTVPVGIWAVTAADEARLDFYEGCPNFYYKTDMELPVEEIKLGVTRTRKCFVYIMHEERKLGIPTSDYMDICREGYIDFGFDEQYLRDACRKSAAGAR